MEDVITTLTEVLFGDVFRHCSVLALGKWRSAHGFRSHVNLVLLAVGWHGECYERDRTNGDGLQKWRLQYPWCTSIRSTVSEGWDWRDGVFLFFHVALSSDVLLVFLCRQPELQSRSASSDQPIASGGLPKPRPLSSLTDITVSLESVKPSE